MTTSSNFKTPSAPEPREDHWSELTALLPAERKLEFSFWVDEELDRLEHQFSRFITAQSLKQDLRRRR